MTKQRVEIPVRAERTEVVAAALWARGALGVWEQPGTLVAWFDTATALAEAPAGAGTLPELSGDLTFIEEPDRDWQAEWKATITPVRAGRAVVVPTWLANEHASEPDDLTLLLDPGRAFGSGHHATTLLCLAYLDELEREGALAGARVADVGCGTGVLAIAAAAWGAHAQAVDIDPTAVEVARANAAINGVQIDTATGSVDAIAPAPIVVANLVTDVIVSLAEPLVAATEQTLIVSGIATARETRALGALEAAGAHAVDVQHQDGWIAARLSVVADTTSADQPVGGSE